MPSRKSSPVFVPPPIHAASAKKRVPFQARRKVKTPSPRPISPLPPAVERLTPAGQERPKALKQRQIAEIKGSSKTASCTSEFRHTSVFKALKAIAHHLNDKQGVRWTKTSVTMIATALEVRLRSIIKDAYIIIRSHNQETLTRKALIAAGAIRGISRNMFLTDDQAAHEVAVVNNAARRGGAKKEKVPAELKGKRALKRKVVRMEEDGKLKDEWNKMKNKEPYASVANAVTGALVKRMNKIENVDRSRRLEVHMALVMVATNFLLNVVGNLLPNAQALKRKTIDPPMVDAVLKNEGFTSVGFTGMARVYRQKRRAAANKDEALVEAADQLILQAQMQQPHSMELP
jgi:histone H3/H4